MHCVAGHATARSCTPRSTPSRSTRSSTRARTRAPRATRAFDATGARGDAARRAASTRSRSSGWRRTTASRTPRSTRCARASRCASTARGVRGVDVEPGDSERALDELRGRGCDRGVGQPGRTTRASACSSGCARTSPTSACSRRSRAVPRDRFVPDRPGGGGVGQRRAADRRRARRSPSRSWSRACASCSRCAATSACSTSAPARATTPPCSRSSPATCGASSATRSCRRGRPSSLAAAGVENVTLRGRRRRRRATRSAAPYDAINVAAAMAVVPARAARRSSPRAGGSSARSTPATSASCCCAAEPGGLERSDARARALRAAGQRTRAEARVRAVLAPDLRARPAVDHHDVGGEVVGAADQRRADAVGVDGHARRLEGADALGVEAARDDDPHVLVAAPASSASRTRWTSSASTPRRPRSAPWRRCSARSASESDVSSRTPHSVGPERLGDLERGRARSRCRSRPAR